MSLFTDPNHLIAKMSIALALAIIVSFCVGLLYEWWSEESLEWAEICKEARSFKPTKALRLPDGRGDAFEVMVENGRDLPAIQTYVWIQIGAGSMMFKVRGLENFFTLGSEGHKRTPKSYIVVDEELTDEILAMVNGGAA